jgi:SpoVK/Ycf46/Vps4 family AAA+-type ATPase
LDGEETIGKSIIIATTNHPELLPENLTIRPSRFNKIIEINNPNEKGRELILKRFFKDKYNDDMLKLTKDLSFDQVKESFIISITNGMDFAKAINAVKNHKKMVEDSFNKYKKIGFSVDNSDDF